MGAVGVIWLMRSSTPDLSGSVVVGPRWTGGNKEMSMTIQMDAVLREARSAVRVEQGESVTGVCVGGGRSHEYVPNGGPCRDH